MRSCIGVTPKDGRRLDVVKHDVQLVTLFLQVKPGVQRTENTVKTKIQVSLFVIYMVIQVHIVICKTGSTFKSKF